MYEMILLDFLRVEEFLELRPQYRNQRSRGKRRENSEPDVAHGYSRSDEWVGKEVEVRWLYNTVRKRYRWEPAKVEERNRDGTYRVFFSGDAYPEDGIPEKDLRKVSKGTLRLVLVSPPNAGEEIQAAHLIRKYGLVHLKFDDLLHESINSSTPGDVIDVEDMIDILQDKIENSDCADKGFLITEFPNSAVQARELDDMLGALGITHVLNMRIPYTVLKKRLNSTAGESKVSEKETEKFLIAQMQRYEAQMMPVLKYYENKGLVRDVHGSAQDEDEVWQRVQAAILRTEAEEEEFRNRKEQETSAISQSIGELERHPTFPKLLPLDGEEEPETYCKACALQ